MLGVRVGVMQESVVIGQWKQTKLWSLDMGLGPRGLILCKHFRGGWLNRERGA